MEKKISKKTTVEKKQPVKEKVQTAEGWKRAKKKEKEKEKENNHD